MREMIHCEPYLRVRTVCTDCMYGLYVREMILVSLIASTIPNTIANIIGTGMREMMTQSVSLITCMTDYGTLIRRISSLSQVLNIFFICRSGRDDYVRSAHTCKLTYAEVTVDRMCTRTHYYYPAAAPPGIHAHTCTVHVMPCTVVVTTDQYSRTYRSRYNDIMSYNVMYCTGF